MITTEFILEQVALALFEPIVNTVLASPVAAPGVAGVLCSNLNLYSGAIVLVGLAGSSLETVAIITVSNTGFTANFVHSHAAGEPVVGATFPYGQPVDPLFTQAQMLGFLLDTQQQFLLQVQPLIFTGASISFEEGVRIYDAPSDAIRVERISIGGSVLFDVSQDDLDMDNSTWPANAGSPTAWYQNKLNNQKIGFNAIPQAGQTAEVWYSQRVASENIILSDFSLATPLLVPDIFWAYIKWGVLARAWSEDGEQRDPMKAAYAQRRYDLGAKLGRNFMVASGAAVKYPQAGMANAGT